MTAQDCKSEVEKGMTKFRWTHATEERRNEQHGLPQTDKHFLQENQFDFRNMKATDMPFNKRVSLPNPLKHEMEVKIQMLKQNLDDITKDYIINNDRNNAQSNLSETQKDGLRSLKERKKSGEVVVFQTDKTNSFSVDTLDNYRIAGQCHTEKDEVITKEQKKNLETMMNAHEVRVPFFLNDFFLIRCMVS